MRVDKAIGVIAIRRTEVRQFTDRQIDLLKTFADQAVIAIENARLFEPNRRASANFKSLWSTRLPSAVCSASSAARPPISNRYSTRLRGPRHNSARLSSVTCPVRREAHTFRCRPWTHAGRAPRLAEWISVGARVRHGNGPFHSYRQR